jgi:hypothetical protein
MAGLIASYIDSAALGTRLAVQIHRRRQKVAAGIDGFMGVGKQNPSEGFETIAKLSISGRL